MRIQLIIPIIGIGTVLGVNVVPIVEATERGGAGESRLAAEIPSQAADSADSLPTCSWEYNYNSATCPEDSVDCTVSVECDAGEGAVSGGCYVAGDANAYLTREKVFQAGSITSAPTDGLSWYSLYENMGFECTYRNAAGGTLHATVLCCGP